MTRLHHLSRAVAALILTGSLAAACNNAGLEDGPSAPSGPDGSAPSGSDLPPAPDCEGPLGAARDPSSLPACCDAAADMHCLDGDLGDKLASLFDGAGSCAGGGTCVADDYIATGGVFTPKTCSSISGAAGTCLSVCAPKVAEKAALLPQDVCDETERCVPCISPLDNEPTGACDLAYTCESGYGDDDTPPAAEPTCPYEGPPIIDPTTLEPCAGCGLGHCLKNDLIPADKIDMFGACDAYQKCVPDTFIASGGNTIPPSCTSIAGAEGRCMSTCMPDVAAQADSLPVDVCGAEQICVPCFDPIDQSPTGACTLSCDPGPTQPPVELETCCSGTGSCLPQASVPADQLADLPQEGECTDAANVCVPHVLLDDPLQLQTCETVLLGNLFGEEYKPGVCLPDCLPAVDSSFLHQDGCPAHQKCAPCIMPPYAEPTGACDLLP